MEQLVYLVLEVLCIASIAVGVAVELGVGWGLVVGGACSAVLLVAAQLPAKPGDG